MATQFINSKNKSFAIYPFSQNTQRSCEAEVIMIAANGVYTMLFSDSNSTVTNNHCFTHGFYLHFGEMSFILINHQTQRSVTDAIGS